MVQTTTPKPPGKSSPWLKRVLVPFWIIQLLFVCVLLGAQIWAATFGLEAMGLLDMIFCAASLILCIVEIVLFARRALHPLTYFVFQCVETTLWLIVSLIVLVQTIRYENAIGIDVGVIFLSGMIEAVVLLVAFLGSLIYASVIYHRHRTSAKPHQHSFSCDCFENGHAINNTFQYQQGSSPPMYVEGERMESGGREVPRALVPGRHEPRREGQLEVHE